MLKTVTLALACCSALFSLNAQAALQALRAGLAVGMSSNELEPAPQGI